MGREVRLERLLGRVVGDAAGRPVGRIEDMRATGNNAVGLGIPFWLPGGGENHPDAILAGQSLWVDGQAIVSDGVIVGPPELARLAERLVPTVPAARRYSAGSASEAR